MRRQVGQTRRTRARGPGSSGAARPGLAEAKLEEGPREPYPVIPHDLTTERDLVGGLASWNHLGAKPDPDDFYDVTLARIARAFIDHGARIRPLSFASVDRDAGVVFAYTYTGLIEVLAELGDTRPRLTAFYAGILGAASGLTDAGHVRRLAALAHARRRLIEIETERGELERLTKDPRR